MIGVFDSGLGGLTILKAFLRVLPDYGYLYLGDNARAPYGNKSQEVLYEYTRQAVEFLFARGADLIILACNTASARALRRIQQQWLPVHHPTGRVLGVVIPLAEAAVEATRYGRIGIIGTRATIASGVYDQELNKLRTGLKIFSQACPLLVPFVEEGWIGKPETKMILKKYLRPLKISKIDTLVLGCTHYPFLRQDIERIMGHACRVLDTPGIVGEKLTDYLRRHPEIEATLAKDARRRYLTTDDPVRFSDLGERFLGQSMQEVERVVLG